MKVLYDEDGYFHNSNGPAMIDIDGGRYWYRHGKLHREDGPASIYSSGLLKYYIDDCLHRLDGPAVVYPDGTGDYWISNIRYTEEEYKMIVFFKKVV